MSEEQDSRGPIGSIRAHPIISGILVGCVLVGVGLGLVLLPAEWALARRLAAGAVAGVGVGLTILATRMIG